MSTPISVNPAVTGLIMIRLFNFRWLLLISGQKNPVRYKLYRYACGRDQRLEEFCGAPQ